MFGGFFGSLGGSVGNAFGGGIFSSIGRFAGKMLGDYLDQLNHQPPEYEHIKNFKESFKYLTVDYGEPIPLIFGTARVSGKIIWADQIKEIENTTRHKEYFPYFHQLKSTTSFTEYSYFFSFAVSICEGEITEINRVWANDEVINLGKYKFRLYKGSETQLPDPLIEKCNGSGKTPAFRSLSYIVFEDLPLEDFGNNIPSFSCEVTRKPNIYLPDNYVKAENLVKAINMIPGSGEFVYDTEVQYKTQGSSFGGIISHEAINSHNHYNIADSVFSLNQLQNTCPNIKWIAPVVCWFGDSLDINHCSLKPAIEFNDSLTSYSCTWQVDRYNRANAKVISKDELNNPNYGGTVNDASLVRYLIELKKRNLKIMFYPMFFMDLPGKPWRGHASGSASSVSNFFHKPEGYNNFILHYARLVKDYVDGFIIGSELIGITSIKDSANNFPAVTELCNLARLVKEIVGNHVQVTYAADWSEYHHTSGGWYNLDPLFASAYIDFVGIDAYFPLTSSVSSQITKEEIMQNCHSGEGYDYYLDGDGNKQALSAPYAWKNLRYWWENHHYNPDGNRTSWEPKMKKIWFTEFGFPSIDKASNQPNVFFDPKCSDGGVPKYSSAATDFSMQRTAIKGFIEYWQTQEYIEEMFLWTWDARPYPAWPHGKIWSDNHLWEKGHWVNGKFGSCSLAEIILELSQRCDIDLSKIDTSTIDEVVDGFILNKVISTIDAINSLRIFYFFDIIANEKEQIEFLKRGRGKLDYLNEKALIKLLDNSYIKQTEIPYESVISKLSINFIDRFDNYYDCYAFINNENISNSPVINIKIPIILSLPEIERIGELILKNASIESKVIKFLIPAIFHGYKPGSFLIFHYKKLEYQIRIVNIKLSALTYHITGVIDNLSSYYLPAANILSNFEKSINTKVKCVILDLPFNLVEGNDRPYLAVYLQSNSNEALYVSTDGHDYAKIANLAKQTFIGSVVNFTLDTYYR
ncbi:MAG TPA: glycoside hydrolase TIM-barrel-like domain-containing protein [Rickettsia endosymbiont of Pyrocoelia pectoralis]|nr:glycoside hydrolase TIM-barrel-like domain-containing protein [Rickettsia endosymbiont of Pyrocoelia pectoralis]